MGRFNFHLLAKSYPRYIFVFAVLFVALSLSCPVKNSLKTLAGVPAHTEHSAPKGSHTFLGSGAEHCVNSATSELSISSTVSGETAQVLPPAFFAAALFCLLGVTGSSLKAFAPNAVLSLPAAVPLFLRYRKLII